jgi:hypothetical protein
MIILICIVKTLTNIQFLVTPSTHVWMIKCINGWMKWNFICNLSLNSIKQLIGDFYFYTYDIC